MKHPFEKFKFCPLCGSNLFFVHDFKSKRCDTCGFTYYYNSSTATVAFILNPKKELLVCKRAKEPALGTLDLPGGFVDMGENAEEGLLREVKEETGMEVVGQTYLFSVPNTYLFSGFLVHTTDLFFLCRVKDETQIQAMDDVSECFWLSLDKVNPEAFGMNSIRKGVTQFLLKYRTSQT